MRRDARWKEGEQNGYPEEANSVMKERWMFRSVISKRNISIVFYSEPPFLEILSFLAFHDIPFSLAFPSLGLCSYIGPAEVTLDHIRERLA